jgi:ketosteroid isomerase-like protein
MHASLFGPGGRATASVVAAVVVVAGALTTVSVAMRAAPTSGEPWDPAAAHDVEMAYHQLHDKWNKLDLVALKASIDGDAVLPTFDFDSDTNEPVRLASKRDIDQFTDRIFAGLKRDGATALAVQPKIACRATAQIGICTEECRVQLVGRDGAKTVQPLRATAVAVHRADGWRWIQWHMSPAGALEHYDATGRLLQ